jgi:predicted negative regulator of RcsB-dependent stress response
VKQAVMATQEQARRMNTPRALALCQCFNGALEFQAGRWAEAEAALRDSIRLHREIAAASGEALACQRLGVLLTARGQLDEGLAILEEGVVAAERALLRAHCLTRLYASMTRNRLKGGDVDTADQYLTLGLAMGERHGNCATCDALLFPAAVSVRVAQRDFAAAESFCHRLDAAAEQYNSRIWIARARQARGELAAAQGDLDVALACYTEAHAAYLAAGNEYEAARCLDAMAALRQTRRATGDLEIARAAQTQAQLIFERLGAAIPSELTFPTTS